MFEDMMVLAFILHVGSGIFALLSGIVSMSARKSGLLHRRAGNVFFVCMLVMATFAIYLGFAKTDELVNVFIGAFVFYLVATAWRTIYYKANTSGLFEKLGLAAAVVLLAPFLVLSIQLALGHPPFFKSALPLEGPIVIAIYLFTSVLAIAVVRDILVVYANGISGAPRIARHLWRMCVALTLATGSALSNGLPRILPAKYAVPDWFLYLQFVWVALLIYWMIRVRLTGWATIPRNEIGKNVAS
jgi:hypothetical protein